MFLRRTPTQDEKERLGQLIRKVRRRRDLTQEKLAERMKCSRRWLSSVERGESSLNWRDMLCLMVILELPPEKAVEEVGLDVSVPADRK